jgi:hypothetical protein
MQRRCSADKQGQHGRRHGHEALVPPAPLSPTRAPTADIVQLTRVTTSTTTATIATATIATATIATTTTTTTTATTTTTTTTATIAAAATAGTTTTTAAATTAATRIGTNIIGGCCSNDKQTSDGDTFERAYRGYEQKLVRNEDVRARA